MKELLTRIRAAWSNLSDRERILVAAVGASFALALSFLLVVKPVLDRRSATEARVASAEQQLQVMARLKAQYSGVSTRLASVEERIRTGSRGNLRTTLENLAQQAGVKIESMENQGSPQNDRYRETKVEIGLKGVTLPQTVNYLHRIETARQVLSVKALRIRTRPGKDASDLLDVTFTVSSFEPV